jgi:fermentation-respiration switch protein FrsA (DUF1100 family)
MSSTPDLPGDLLAPVHAALGAGGAGRRARARRPALDWRQILSFGATEIGLPGLAAKPVEWAIGARIDVDWDSVDAARHPEDFQLPILLFHGTGDDIVPLAVSEEFAEALPGRVELHRAPDAGHVEAWNVAPRRYEGQLTRFLERVGATAPSRSSRK